MPIIFCFYRLKQIGRAKHSSCFVRNWLRNLSKTENGSSISVLKCNTKTAKEKGSSLLRLLFV